MKPTDQLSFVIPEEMATLRLDQALAQLAPNYSRTQIKTWIEDGHILVNEKLSKPKYKTQGGDHITMIVIPRETPSWKAEAIPLTIHYEDEAILVINKPAGLVVHPGAGNAEATLLNALLHYLP